MFVKRFPYTLANDIIRVEMRILWIAMIRWVGVVMGLKSSRFALSAAHERIPDPNEGNIQRIERVSDSPSLIQLIKDPKEVGNVFDSPSCLLMGGNRSTAIDVRSSPSVTVLTRQGAEKVDALNSPSVIYQGLSDAAIKNAMASPSIQLTAESKTRYDLPLPLIVGHPLIKTALMAIAVNPEIGGLVIEGGRGTGKSVLAKAIHRVLPELDVVADSPYNLAPNASTLSTDIRMVTCPFVQVPLNIMEDRLFGAIDVKRTLDSGESVFTPGLLATSNRGLLVVDDINLLDNEITTTLLQAITDGFVQVEREGMNVRYPCKPSLIATFNSDDADLKDSFKDRIGISLSTDAYPLSLQERVQVVHQVTAFAEGLIDIGAVHGREGELKAMIIEARKKMSHVKVIITTVSKFYLALKERIPPLFFRCQGIS